MLIYRVENSKRQGPYCNSQNSLAGNPFDPRHPEPGGGL